MTKRKETTTRQLKRIIDLHSKDLTLREIAAITGLSYETIRKMIITFKRSDQHNQLNNNHDKTSNR